MNVFARVEERVVAALEALKGEGALPADLTVSGIEVATPRDPTHGDLATNAALVLAKPARMKPRDIAEKLKEKLEADADVAQAEVAGPGFLNLTFKPAFWQGLVRTILEEGADYGRIEPRQGRDRQRRVRLRQSDGPDARRPLPRRGVRRCALQPAGVRRLQGDARVLRQRCRRPGRRARALRVPALPRGAGRGHRRDPRGPLSGRLPEAGRRGARQGARRRAASRCPRTEWLPIVRTVAIEPMHADDQGRSRRAQHQARRVLLGSLADLGQDATRSRRRSRPCAPRA